MFDKNYCISFISQGIGVLGLSFGYCIKNFSSQLHFSLSLYLSIFKIPRDNLLPLKKFPKKGRKLNGKQIRRSKARREKLPEELQIGHNQEKSFSTKNFTSLTPFRIIILNIVLLKFRHIISPTYFIMQFRFTLYGIFISFHSPLLLSILYLRAHRCRLTEWNFWLFQIIIIPWVIPIVSHPFIVYIYIYIYIILLQFTSKDAFMQLIFYFYSYSQFFLVITISDLIYHSALHYSSVSFPITDVFMIIIMLYIIFFVIIPYDVWSMVFIFSAEALTSISIVSDIITILHASFNILFFSGFRK
eukprot:gene8617-6049_t